MGFFSAVKKFFGAGSPEKATQEAQPVEAAAEEKAGGAPEPAEDLVPGSPASAEVEEDAGAEPSDGVAGAGEADHAPEPVKGNGEERRETGEARVPEVDLAPARGTLDQESAEDRAEDRDIDLPKEGAEVEGQPVGLDAGEAATVEIAVADSADQEDAELIQRLREAEPRLSQWLNIILEGQEEVNERFWQRLRFLLRSLEAPEAETETFLEEFSRWLARMDYNYVDEFRSELQYRLALALDLEDEEDERNRLMLKLSQGLAATREKLGQGLNALFRGHGELDDAFWEELEELFIMADLGYDTALEIVARLKRRAARENVTVAAEVGRLLQDELEDIFRQEPRIRAVNKPEVILMMGVNGAGKTTTIAKLAHRERMAGKKVLVAAADTFRAAAIEQLQVWAERADADFFARPPGSDPASVAWGAMDYALQNDIDVVFVDTAGRLQTRVNLMEELGKIRQVLAKKHPGAPHRNILVLDATTGQNALSQAKLFREAAGADELILTKLDGTAKGGVAIAVALQEKLPISYIGLGEKMDDLRPFHGADFARALLGASGDK